MAVFNIFENNYKELFYVPRIPVIYYTYYIK